MNKWILIIWLIVVNGNVYGENSEKRCEYSSECPALKLMKPPIKKINEIGGKINELNKQIKKLEKEMEIERQRIKIIDNEMLICELKRENPFDGCIKIKDRSLQAGTINK